MIKIIYYFTISKSVPVQKKVSISEIKEKYGKIEIFTLNSGKKYTGAASFDGDTIKFET